MTAGGVVRTWGGCSREILQSSEKEYQLAGLEVLLKGPEVLFHQVSGEWHGRTPEVGACGDTRAERNV